MANQWAPGHDNEAGFVAILPNKAGSSTAMISPIRFAEYAYSGAITAKGKGEKFCEIEMSNVSFADYTSMRETDLGFSGFDDTSTTITIQLDDPDQSTTSNYNATLIHRPGVDTELSDDGRRFARVVWLVVITGDT